MLAVSVRTCRCWASSDLAEGYVHKNVALYLCHRFTPVTALTLFSPSALLPLPQPLLSAVLVVLLSLRKDVRATKSCFPISSKILSHFDSSHWLIRLALLKPLHLAETFPDAGRLHCHALFHARPKRCTGGCLEGTEESSGFSGLYPSLSPTCPVVRVKLHRLTFLLPHR